MLFNAQRPLAGLIGPSSSSSSQFSQQYDYSGLEDHLKRQEDLASLADAGRSALYDGDVRSGLSAARRIPALLQTLRAVAPDTTTQRPRQLINPLSKVTSTSSSSSGSTDTGKAEFAAGPKFEVPQGGGAGGGAGGGGGGGGQPADPQPEKPKAQAMAEMPAAALPRQIDEDRENVIHDRRKPKKRQVGDYGEMMA